VIFSILPLLDVSFFGVGGSHYSVYGNHDSNCKLIKLEALSAGQMSEFRQLLKFPQQVQERLFPTVWAEMRLAHFRGVGSFEAILVDLQ